MKTPILGSSYVARSVNAADNRMVNLFPELIPEGGKEPAFLNRAPGLRLILAVGTGPIRGMRVFGGFCYVVSGETLFRVDNRHTVTEIGRVSGNKEPVRMADNGDELLIACNGPGFIYTASEGKLEQITDPDFPGAVTVDYVDGYFVFNEPDSDRIWTTRFQDGLNVDGLDRESVIGSPDGVVGVIVDHKEVWVFGENSVEVWYKAGGIGFPLAAMPGAFNEVGCCSPYSIAKMDNGIFWLGQDARGQGMVYRAEGYKAVRVSTHAVEWQIQKYPDLSDAIGYTYQQDGHSFYVLVFPSADTTWVYDAATQSWHERAGLKRGKFTRHRGNCQAFFGGETLIGDYENGNIYAFDLDVYDDNGEPQKWLRSWRALPTGENNLKRTSHHSLQLDCESGVGLVSGQGSDPKVMLRWSDDGGHTWSNEHWASLGKIGEFGRRVIWRRLGMTMKIRDRVYEVSGTDPVKIAILGAELIVSGTNA